MVYQENKLLYNLLRSDLSWQAEYISANVSRFYKILVKYIYVLEFAFYKLFFLLVYIFCCDIKYNIIIWGENIVWNWQYIYRNYIGVYLF